jgi:quinol monooxygenase YgiN
MFVQVIQGRTSQPQALVDAFDRWTADLSSGATGWLGSTGGVTEDGRFIVVARFESEEAAMANSARPEQDAWWAETAKLLDGEAAFRNSTDVDVNVNGDPDQAGFVQVMQGRGSDPERAKQLMAQDADQWAAFRPDMIGSVAIGHDEGAYTMVMYFTSEAAAREGERKEPPQELQAQMEEMNQLNIGEPEFFDLKQPILNSPD